jgi:hypothetical protein
VGVRLSGGAGGIKAHAQVEDEMARFAAEVAPSFANG